MNNPESHLSTDEDLVDLLRAEFERMELDPSQFEDDDESPEVDRKVLGQLADRKLGKAETKLLSRYIFRYKEWRSAYCDILVKKYKASQTELPGAEKSDETTEDNTR